MPRRPENLEGQRFGRLVAVRRVPTPGGKASWACLCDCGGQTSVRIDALKAGQVKSCGCFRREHGAAVLSALATHRMSKTPIYKLWVRMLARCNNPEADCYKHYGGRGIRVCTQWHSFERFFEDIGRHRRPGTTLDRIDNDGHYEPGNVRWTTQQQQTWNMRCNVLVRVKDEILVMSEAARRAGLDPSWYRKKLLRGAVAGAELLGRRG